MCRVYIYKDDNSINDCDDDIFLMLFVYEFTLYIINGMNKTYYGVKNTQRIWFGVCVLSPGNKF